MVEASVIQIYCVDLVRHRQQHDNEGERESDEPKNTQRADKTMLICTASLHSKKDRMRSTDPMSKTCATVITDGMTK